MQTEMISILANPNFGFVGPTTSLIKCVAQQNSSHQINTTVCVSVWCHYVQHAELYDVGNAFGGPDINAQSLTHSHTKSIHIYCLIAADDQMLINLFHCRDFVNLQLWTQVNKWIMIVTMRHRWNNHFRRRIQKNEHW